METNENLPIMVLVHESPDKLLFKFSSTLWGFVTLFISLILGVGTYYALFRENTSWIILVILLLLTLLFLYSSIYSFKLKRTLEINNTGQFVKYTLSNLYKNINWHKEFGDFRSVKVFRPVSTINSPGVTRAKNWYIQIIANDGEIFQVGYNQFGSISRRKAEQLMDRIAGMMDIEKEIIDD